jgi:hypothetical protein
MDCDKECELVIGEEIANASTEKEWRAKKPSLLRTIQHAAIIIFMVDLKRLELCVFLP